MEQTRPSAEDFGEPEWQPFKVWFEQAFRAIRATAAQDNAPGHDEQGSGHDGEAGLGGACR